MNSTRRKYLSLAKLAGVTSTTGCLSELTDNGRMPNRTVADTPSQTPIPMEPIEGSHNDQFSNPNRIERHIHELTNSARRESTRSTLIWSDNLAYVARDHSQDMDERGYIDHVNPDGESPQERVENYNLKFSGIIENIAFSTATRGKTSQELSEYIFEMWMTSEKGHREALLRDSRTHEGIGIYLPEDGGVYATQLLAIEID